MDEFEQIAADLEKSIKVDETTTALTAEEQAFLKDPANVRKALAAGAKTLLKAKGAMETDLSQEKKVKDKNVTDDEDDPAETPVKSGQGYKNSSSYVGKMGKGEDDADDDGDEDKPSFFGKKKAEKKKMKKSEVVADEAGDDDLVDVTEDLAEIKKAMSWIVDSVHEVRKSQAALIEGSAIFGQVLHQVAENDPRRDNLNITMAKALNKALGELADLKKSITTQNDLVKSVTELSGAPRVAGLSLLKAEAEAGASDGATSNSPVSKKDHERLYKAAVSKSISREEYQHAMKTGDTSVLAKANA